jgi:hypothetical protein
MKPLFCLLVLTASLAAQAPAFPKRDLKPGLPGITVGPTTHYDETVGAFAVKRGGNDTAVVFIDEQPGVGGNSFQLHGEVKYEGVGDKGYLEMLTRVGGAKLSSQTQGDQTVMTKLMGSWRNFILRVTLAGSNVPAKQVELNAVLPDGGMVWLRNLRLEPLTTETQSATLSIILGSTAFLLSILLWFIWRAGKKQRAAELKAQKK